MQRLLPQIILVNILYKKPTKTYEKYFSFFISTQGMCVVYKCFREKFITVSDLQTLSNETNFTIKTIFNVLYIKFKWSMIL